MNFMVWISVGVLTAGIACLVTRTHRPPRALLYLFAGVAAAVIGGELGSRLEIALGNAHSGLSIGSAFVGLGFSAMLLTVLATLRPSTRAHRYGHRYFRRQM